MLRQLVDEHLTDHSSRPPVRRAWDALDEHEQRQVIGRADSMEGITAAQHWIVAGGQSEQDRLLGAVVWTLGSWGAP